MNKQEWNEGLNQIDDDIVESYVKEKETRRQIRSAAHKVLKYGAIVATVILVLSGILKQPRISFDADTLGEELAHHVNADTVVINKSKATFSNWSPVYRIKEHYISVVDYVKMKEALGLPDNPAWIELDGNKLSYDLANYTDSSRGYFTMTEEEAVERAWELFNKIPFIEGEYECGGIRETFTLTTSEGTFIDRAGVVFFRVLDGIRVVGDSCTIYFDGSGFEGISIKMFDYQKVGIMRRVPLEDALERVKTPDSFTLDTQKVGPGSVAETLQIDRINLRYVNQHYRGCTILQPVYVFNGTATLKDKTEASFQSIVIAIPEFYTYEKHRG